MSNSVRPHRWQPMRLRRPWDSPGKNTGVGCHFLLQRMKVKSESEVAQSCLILCSPMDRSLPGCSVHEIFQARILEQVAISYSRGHSRPRDQTCVSCNLCCDLNATVNKASPPYLIMASRNVWLGKEFSI